MSDIYGESGGGACGTRWQSKQGPASRTGRADSRTELSLWQERFRRRMRRSYREAGITEEIEIVHAWLLSRARQLSRSMSWQAWRERDQSGTTGQLVLRNSFEGMAGGMRDRVIRAVLGNTFANLIGAPLTYIAGFEMIAEESNWNARSQRDALAYRQQRIYAWLLSVIAQVSSDGDIYLEDQTNQRLVQEGLAYLRWRRDYYPAVRRWVTQNVPTRYRLGAGAWEPRP